MADSPLLSFLKSSSAFKPCPSRSYETQSHSMNLHTFTPTDQLTCNLKSESWTGFLCFKIYCKSCKSCSAMQVFMRLHTLRQHRNLQVVWGFRSISQLAMFDYQWVDLKVASFLAKILKVFSKASSSARIAQLSGHRGCIGNTRSS